ncbi:hypothetical protein MCUN1_000427 [Malassezia cuniculi]|uniref:Uncharacterized protein n=1 Tax=Malassezia cuniculi TaxID=948313 RepID=A0AAF0J5P4_9BASI|nr:hypothetical protein MCUN1_000427 [Malassezia cuniculi]
MHSRSVPKFGSFKARVPLQPEEPPDEKRAGTSSSSELLPSGKRRRDSRYPRREQSPPPPARETPVRSEHFLLDRFGDRNARYGPSRDKPRYSRATARVLGLHENMQIVASTDTHVTIESAMKGRTPGFYARLAASTSDVPEKIIAKAGVASYPDFVATDVQDETPEQDIQKSKAHEEARALNEHLHAHPSDTDSWLKLVHLQKRLAPHDTSAAAIARVRVAVLERAESVQKSADLTLTLARMRLLADNGLESGPRLHEMWKELISRAEYKHAELWLAYLEFCRSDLHTFELDAVLATHAEALRALCAQPGADEARITIVREAAVMLKSAGHLELAVALFQALLEINFERSDLPADAVLDIFEAWWDAGSPRIGDPGDYQGFSTVPRHESVHGIIEQDTHESNGDDNDDDDDWLVNELKSASDRPKRLAEQGDPFAFILAEDLRDYLFFLRDQQSLVTLLDAYLHIIGHPLGWIRSIINLQSGTPTECIVSAPQVIPKWGQSAFPDDGTVRLFPLTFDTLYADRNGPRRSWWNHFQAPHDERANLIISHFLWRAPHLDNAAHLTVAQSALSVCKTGRKILRNALQKDQHNVALWCAYAYFEYAHGNIDAVRRVCAQVLSVEGSNPVSLPLWTLWARLEWISEDPSSCWGVLRAYTRGDASLSNTCVTSVEKLYILRRLSWREPTLTAIAVSLAQNAQTLYELQGPLHVFEEALRNSPNKRGQLAMELLDFIHMHRNNSRGAFRACDVQNAVVQVVDYAPSPALFLLAEYELTRLGNTVQRVANEFTDARRWAVSICVENSRNQSARYMRRRIDIAVENAPNAPILWHIALAIERQAVAAGSADNARVKSLIYKGIRHCPYEKALYLAAHTPEFSGAFTDDELRELRVLLGEKELRVYREMDGHASDAMTLISQFVDSVAKAV